jgi:type II secretory pathway component PulJ
MRSSRTSTRSAYTLIEMMISMPLMALLMLGMSSAIYISMRSIPDNTTSSSARIQAAAALDQLAADFAYATSIVSRSPTSVVLTTVDRTGDNVADSVSYQWSGVVGTPLLRQFNGSASEKVIQSVQQFSLSYTAPIDVALGVPLLKTVDVQIAAPTGATSAVYASITAVNQPQLP